MKYQFQFAGANVSRRSSPPRKRMRIVLLVVAFILALLAYWQYLQHLTHPPLRKVPVAGAAAAASATASTAKTAIAAKTATTAAATTTVTAKTVGTATATVTTAPITATTTEAKPAPTATTSTAAQSVPMIKKAADSAIALVKHVLPQSATATPAEATPVATATVSTEPATPAQADPSAVPVLRITTQPPPPPVKPQVRTPEELLMRAGVSAFNNIMTLAAKYPDSYGFQAATDVEDAQLGKPIPVYTIDEADRAKYKSGEPLKPLLKPINAWVFPVCVGGRVCCMVQVKSDGDDYAPDRGSKLLGTAWNKILERWPASQGYHPCIVVNPNIPGYFFTVPELPTQNLTDIISLTYYHPNLSPADVILASWR